MATLEATTTITLEPELDEIVTRLAAKEGKPKALYLRRLLLDALEDAEDYWAAEDAMTEHQRSGGKTYSAQEIGHELGVDD
jgi:predicted DNA-binding protein